jgi:hypothetical protein
MAAGGVLELEPKELFNIAPAQLLKSKARPASQKAGGHLPPA